MPTGPGESRALSIVWHLPRANPSRTSDSGQPGGSRAKADGMGGCGRRQVSVVIVVDARRRACLV